MCYSKKKEKRKKKYNKLKSMFHFVSFRLVYVVFSLNILIISGEVFVSKIHWCSRETNGFLHDISFISKIFGVFCLFISYSWIRLELFCVVRAAKCVNSMSIWMEIKKRPRTREKESKRLNSLQILQSTTVWTSDITIKTNSKNRKKNEEREHIVHSKRCSEHTQNVQTNRRNDVEKKQKKKKKKTNWHSDIERQQTSTQQSKLPLVLKKQEKPRFKIYK